MNRSVTRRVYLLCVVGLVASLGVGPLGFDAAPVRADDDERQCAVVGSVAGGGRVESDGYCDNQAIVQFGPKAKVGRFLREYRLRLLDAIPGRRIFLVAFPRTTKDAAAVQRLNRDRRTAFAELNFVGQAPEARPRRFYFAGDTGPQPGSLKDAYAPGLIGAAGCEVRGAQTTVAVIDTGLDKSHDAVEGRVLEAQGWNVLNDSSSYDDTEDGIDNDRDGAIDEAHGHGTHVAGIVAQIAPEARILPIKAVNDDGSGDAYHLAKAIYYAGDRNPDVVNLSIGSTRNARVVAGAVGALAAKGIVVVAAAGNQGVASPVDYPASTPSVISVASTDRNDDKSAFTNFNGQVDLSAPGSDIVSAFPGNNQYRIWSGTSMATPWVAGAAALLIDQSPTLKPAEVRAKLEGSAEPVGAGMGKGRLDVAEAVGCGAPAG